jgi:endonuclease/exonuclease/phosphatase family metal-dependent hydrolase
MQECYDVDPTPLLPGPGWNHARSAPELMVASRHPLRLVDRIDLRRERRGGSAAEFEITWNGRAIRVVDVHAASLRKGFDALIQRDPDAMTAFMSIAMIHREEAEHARSWIARGDGPLIVAGDFNAAADNPTFRAVWGDLEDAYTVASWGLGSTYSTRLMRIRIDHILTGPGWRAQRAWVGPNVRSQHYPLLADLEWVGE